LKKKTEESESTLKMQSTQIRLKWNPLIVMRD
jgi:ubiquitin